MTNQEIANFNQELLKNNSDINIIDYIKLVNDQFFKIDISFIDDFMDLVGKNNFIIHHDMLFKYEVLTKNEDTTTNVLKMLNTNDFKMQTDYITSPDPAGSDRPHVLKNNYYLKPKTFKKILMRSLKTQKYADYYLFLEEIISHFNDFKIKLEEINKQRTD